jgi:hypothetical protein
VGEVHSGCRVVVLNKEQRERAEGTLDRLEKAGKAANGMQRYNVYIRDLSKVDYQPEALNRCGIAVR